MEESRLRRLATEYLVPFFSGASLGLNSLQSSPRDELFSFRDPQTIVFKVARSDRYRLALEREQPFAPHGTAAVTEWDVVAAFVMVVKDMEPGLGTPFEADLLANLQRRVVAQAIKLGKSSTMLAVIDQLSSWGGRLYEGAPVVAGVGLDPGGATSSPLALEDIKNENFAQVLSNGFDTLLTFDAGGRYLGYEVLQQPPTPVSFAPARYSAVADWAAGARIAFTLNRLGEILVFRDQNLVFARRSGIWHFLTHTPIVRQMKHPSRNPTLRTAIYESALDVSFARTGACIGAASVANVRSWKTVATAASDYLATSTSVKAEALRRVVGGKLFQDLDRRTRQELLAIDGATILGPDGEILAVGTILKVGGSAGGGREAAAIAVSKLGLGVKVSQDGRISGYHGGQSAPVLAVM